MKGAITLGLGGGQHFGVGAWALSVGPPPPPHLVALLGHLLLPQRVAAGRHAQVLQPAGVVVLVDQHTGDLRGRRGRERGQCESRVRAGAGRMMLVGRRRMLSRVGRPEEGQAGSPPALHRAPHLVPLGLGVLASLVRNRLRQGRRAPSGSAGVCVTTEPECSMRACCEGRKGKRAAGGAGGHLEVHRLAAAHDGRARDEHLRQPMGGVGGTG